MFSTLDEVATYKASIDWKSLDIDENIKPLVLAINQSPFIVTTNCCAGHYRWCKGTWRLNHSQDDSILDGNEDWGCFEKTPFCNRVSGFPYLQWKYTKELEPFIQQIKTKTHPRFNYQTCGITYDEEKLYAKYWHQPKFFDFWKTLVDTWNSCQLEPRLEYPKNEFEVKGLCECNYRHGNDGHNQDYSEYIKTLFKPELFGDDYINLFYFSKDKDEYD
jgi:hypothetical protein